MIHPEPKFFKHLLIMFFLAFTACSYSQYGVLDPDFLPNDHGRDSSCGIKGTVYTVAAQSDGSLLAAGSIYGYNDNNPRMLVRFNPDGSFDAAFNAPMEAVIVKKIAVRTDGKILVGGLFDFNGYVNLILLNSNGSIDENFPTAVTDGEVRDIRVLSDGRFIIAGNFTTVSGQMRNGTAILHSNGTLDESYVPANPETDVNSVCVQDDGKVVIASVFVRRLLPNGDIDNSYTQFSLASNNTPGLYHLQMQPDGKIILVGGIVIFNEINGIIRFNTDGTRDLTFTSVALYNTFQTRRVYSVVQLADGSFIIGGKHDYTAFVQHLFPNGVQDPNYESDADFSGVNANIYSLCKVENNIAVGGFFQYSEGARRNNLMKLDLNGNIITNFHVMPGPNGRINKVVSHEDKLIVCGSFNSYNGFNRGGIARLHQNGETDQTFAFDYQESNVTAFACQNDNKIVYNYGTELKRLNADGTVDNTFSGAIFTGTLVDILVADDGGIYSICSDNITRYSSDGTPDNSYISSFSGGTIKQAALFPGNKLIISGFFQQLITRLNSDGSTDDSFLFDDPPFSPNNFNFIQFFITGDKILCSYRYPESVSEAAATFRLNPDGQVDSTFNTSIDVNNFSPLILGVQPDGNILSLEYDDNTSSQLITRLLPSGKRDYSFPVTEVGFSNYPMNCEVISDERFTLYNDYLSYNGHPKNNLAMIKNCPGAVYTEHVSTYDSYTWTNGITYTATTEGVVQTFAVSGECDSTAILDLIVFDPEIQVFTLPSSVDECTGTAFISMNGASPFLFDIGSGDVPGDHEAVFTDLCPGIYNASVMDNFGNIFTTSFVIASDSSYISTDPFEDNDPILDSLSFTIETCDVDIETISEIYIDTFEVLSTNELEVTWGVVDANDTTFVTAVYNFNEGEGNYYIQLHIYCPEKSLARFFVGTLGVYFNGNGISSLGLKDKKELVISLFPNPASEKITIRFEENNAVLIIRDINGKQLFSKIVSSNEQIDLSGFADGVYLFELSTEKGKAVERVIKN